MQNDYKPIINMKDMCVCISIVDTSNATDGTLYDGIYGSSQLWVYDSTDVQGINSKVNEYVQKPDAKFERLRITSTPQEQWHNHSWIRLPRIVCLSGRRLITVSFPNTFPVKS